MYRYVHCQLSSVLQLKYIKISVLIVLLVYEVGLNPQTITHVFSPEEVKETIKKILP